MAPGHGGAHAGAMLEQGDPLATLAFLAHELRTPLAAIAGAGENLEDLLGEAASPAVRASLASILHASDQAAALVEQVLEDASLNAGKLRLQPELLLWAPVCEEVISVLAPRAQAGGQRLVLAGIGSPRVHADPLRLRQILLNLGENALKFSPPGGRVCLGVGDDPSGQVCAWVSDEGPGVPLDEADAIFERYRRGQDQGQRPGMGLGLAIAKGLAEAMGGRLWLTNPGEPGACFRLSLPASAPN